jgi:hypothetical protein
MGGPTQPAALLEQDRSRGGVDGAVDAAPTEQRGVGGVHDGVEVLLGDVALDRLELHR